MEDDNLQHWDLKNAEVYFRTSCLTYTVPDAMLWDVEMPNLYILTVELIKDGQCIDSKKSGLDSEKLSLMAKVSG